MALPHYRKANTTNTSNSAKWVTALHLKLSLPRRVCSAFSTQVALADSSTPPLQSLDEIHVVPLLSCLFRCFARLSSVFGFDGVLNASSSQSRTKITSSLSGVASLSVMLALFTTSTLQNLGVFGPGFNSNSHTLCPPLDGSQSSFHDSNPSNFAPRLLLQPLSTQASVQQANTLCQPFNWPTSASLSQRIPQQANPIQVDQPTLQLGSNVHLSSNDSMLSDHLLFQQLSTLALERKKNGTLWPFLVQVHSPQSSGLWIYEPIFQRLECQPPDPSIPDIPIRLGLNLHRVRGFKSPPSNVSSANPRILRSPMAQLNIFYDFVGSIGILNEAQPGWGDKRPGPPISLTSRLSLGADFKDA
eukprot:Gb_27446 [translate_table: standard]